MSTFLPPQRMRHPLGLPAGSVRSILTLLVVGMVCALSVIHFKDEKLQRIPPYLVYLVFLILGSFFSAHGSSINRTNADEPPPLYLPRGFIRVVLVLLMVGTVAWSLYNDLPDLQHWSYVLSNTVERLKVEPFLPVYVLGGFFLGLLARLIFGGGNKKQNPVYQDIIAWVSLLAMVGLAIQILIDFVINPSLSEGTPKIEMPQWEGVLAGIIAFYFSARS